MNRLDVMKHFEMRKTLPLGVQRYTGVLDHLSRSANPHEHSAATPTSAIAYKNKFTWDNVDYNKDDAAVAESGTDCSNPTFKIIQEVK